MTEPLDEEEMQSVRDHLASSHPDSLALRLLATLDKRTRERAAAEADVERLRETVDERAEEHRLGCERPKGAVNWRVHNSITIERLYAALDATTPRGSALRAAKAKAWDEGFSVGLSAAWPDDRQNPYLDPETDDDGGGHG